MITRNVHWVTLLADSLAADVIRPHIRRVLDQIRTDYRNKWIHVDIDEISEVFPVPPNAGSRTETPESIVIETSPDEYKSIFTSTAAQQEALNCLWLTAVALYHMYGGIGYVDDPSIA